MGICLISRKIVLKIVVLLTIAFSTSNLSAQKITADVAVGTYKFPFTDPYIKNMYSAQIGIGIEYPLWKKHLVSVSTGLKYLYRNSSFSIGEDFESSTGLVTKQNSVTRMMNFAAIPIKVRKYFSIKGLKPFVEFGYNTQYFVSGVAFSEYYNPYTEATEKRTELYHNETFKSSFSYGSMFGVGIEYNNFQISIVSIDNKYSGMSKAENAKLINVSYFIN